VEKFITAIPAARDWHGNGRKATTEVSSMADDKPTGSLSGLTDIEAKEFHNIFVSTFFIFVLIAFVAHFLAWQWRPWLPGPEGYTTSSIMEDARAMASYIQYAFTA
jgi:light-harvesting complex 1 beta chain